MKLKLLTSQIKFDIETWSLSQTQVKFWRLDLRLDSSSNLLACQELEFDSSSSSSRDFRLASRVKSIHSSLKLDLTISLDTSNNMWKACKWTRNKISKKICMSTLHDHSFMLSEIDSIKKALILLKKFFLSSSTIILTNIQEITYNQNLKLKNIQFHEMTKIIAMQIFNKISKHDDIINRILKWINDIIASHLQRIFNVNLKINYCSKHFKKSITIAMRKSQKEIYSFAFSYRSITLLNTINKIMKFILIVEKYSLRRCCSQEITW